MNKTTRLIVGEPMPDKNDPKYKDRYEKEVKAGRQFAKTVHIDKAAGKVQIFALQHSKLFLVIVFGFVIGCFVLNVGRIFIAYSSDKPSTSVIQRQEQALKARHNRIMGTPQPVVDAPVNQQNTINHEYTGNQTED